MSNIILNYFGGIFFGIFFGILVSLNATRALKDFVNKEYNSIENIDKITDIFNIILAISILLYGTFIFTKSIIRELNNSEDSE